VPEGSGVRHNRRPPRFASLGPRERPAMARAPLDENGSASGRRTKSFTPAASTGARGRSRPTRADPRALAAYLWALRTVQ
jgi:hypothetical protein